MQKLKKIVIIGGCGHLGLPLGIVIANCGLDVVLLDKFFPGTFGHAGQRGFTQLPGEPTTLTAKSSR
jgi:2-polyprenyl-6-methoxyphenol hydroxylase-like FAD-dependent oxidoreductase